MQGLIRGVLASLTIGLAVPGAAIASSIDGAVRTAERWARSHASLLGVTQADLRDLRLSSAHRTRHNRVTHVYLQQRLGDVPVLDAVLTVNLSRGRVVHSQDSLVERLAAQVDARRPSLLAATAVATAARRHGVQVDALRSTVGASLLGRRRARGPVLVYARRAGRPRLAWLVEIQEDSHYWITLVSATDGSILDEFDLVQNDSYAAYPFPIESPEHAAGSLAPPSWARPIVPGSAADPVASPLGWHDLDGLPGPDATDTSGNNVRAQTDRPADNLYVPAATVHPAVDEVIAAKRDTRPSSATRDFRPPLDFAKPPSNYAESAVTQLFYATNALHDLFYRYGFDEAAGNFQFNNYLRGGVGGDPVEADAQDGSGSNNANMLTLPEGASPRMQMFEWTPPPLVRITGPTGPRQVPYWAALHPAQVPLEGLVADVQLANDGIDHRADQYDQRTDGCQRLLNFVAGRIAFLEAPAACGEEESVWNAQQAGASAVIYRHFNDDGYRPRLVQDSRKPLNIPMVLVQRTPGGALKDLLDRPRPGELDPSGQVRDSDFDNGVIAHEYGHGISQRLTGGAALGTCVGSDQTGSEGWSDYFALAFTDRGGSPPHTRTVASYLRPGGIRSVPYSLDLRVDPRHYSDLRDPRFQQVHAMGEVWASALWDMHWALTDGVTILGLPGRGFDQDVLRPVAPLAGNEIAIRLVMDGLKFQTCRPSFTDSRDAILAAEKASFGGRYRCHVWWAFARRGMGTDAHDGGELNTSFNVTPSDTLPDDCRLPPLTVPDDAREVKYPAGWNQRHGRYAHRRSYHRHDGAGEAATYSFTGDRVAWWYGRSITGGRVEVLVDGKPVDVVDQREPGVVGHPVFDGVRVYRGLGAGGHTLSLRPLSGTVTVDGFGG